MALKPTVARYALAGPGPLLTQTILLADRVHRALVELSDGSAVFTGCDELQAALAGPQARPYLLRIKPAPGPAGRGRDHGDQHLCSHGL
ncbi:hypothetical protein [Methanothrix soehngenii]|uniref:hypothetical protein n=1 Tax=Methanothrix soehngenii TaxID=2223 RepID=UPI00300CF008